MSSQPGLMILVMQRGESWVPCSSISTTIPVQQQLTAIEWLRVAVGCTTTVVTNRAGQCTPMTCPSGPTCSNQGNPGERPVGFHEAYDGEQLRMMPSFFCRGYPCANFLLDLNPKANKSVKEMHLDVEKPKLAMKFSGSTYAELKGLIIITY